MFCKPACGVRETGVEAAGLGLSLMTWEPTSCWFRDGNVLQKFQPGLKGSGVLLASQSLLIFWSPILS